MAGECEFARIDGVTRHHVCTCDGQDSSAGVVGGAGDRSWRLNVRQNKVVHRHVFNQVAIASGCHDDLGNPSHPRKAQCIYSSAGAGNGFEVGCNQTICCIVSLEHQVLIYSLSDEIYRCCIELLATLKGKYNRCLCAKVVVINSGVEADRVNANVPIGTIYFE